MIGGNRNGKCRYFWNISTSPHIITEYDVYAFKKKMAFINMYIHSKILIWKGSRGKRQINSNLVSHSVHVPQICTCITNLSLVKWDYITVYPSSCFAIFNFFHLKRISSIE